GGAAHLAEERMAGISNRRNSQQSKTVRSEYDPWEIESSRDRNGSFKPELIGKHERQMRNGVYQYVLDMYRLEMGHEDIRRYIRDRHVRACP
ncbi:MAG TPA: transposase, partial [Saprospiraceae bacterium]|nr:transposase [Saprospiraceae bacterium]